MEKEKRLTIEMFIFCFIIFVLFGIIVANEKLAPLNIKKVNQKFINYIEENYKDIKDEISIEKTIYKNTKYRLKVKNKTNSNLYFYIYYSNKKITSTYKNDYIKGEKFLKTIEQKIEKKINKITNKNYKVEIKNTLNNFNTYTRQNLLEEKNLTNLQIYNITLDSTINNFNTTEIINSITELTSFLEKNNITPKTYNIIFTLKNNPTKSLQINNLTNDLIKSNDLNLIISDIINKESSNILTNNNITYKYFN